MSPRLTIAIPTLNRAGLLRRAIESALAQTSPDIEILVSDNGSTDDTQAVIERYTGRGLRTFRHATTMSAPKHGTFLMEQARGEFFLGLSDDDFLEPEFAAEVLAALDRNPKLAFVYTGCAVHYEDHEVPALVGPTVEPGTTFLAEHYAGRREVSWCACVTRVKDLREVGPQPEDRIMGDMFFWTKLAFKGPVGCVPRVLSHYILLRSRNDNISHGTPPAVWARDSQTTVNEIFALVRQTGADAEYESRLRADTRQYVSRSAANQFVWNRIRGASAFQALGWIPSCLAYLSWSPIAWSRVAAAVVAPPGMLRRQLLNAAAKRAENRQDRRAATQTLSSNTPCPAHR
jgi:glycosyltransferase involved in cell wall biosynthesis